MISIIIPIYNTEKYISQCLASLLEQTFHDFEIILVDDGSTDSSPEICNRYASDYPFIRVIHTENQGAAKARLTGTKASSGEYITYIDSDDLVTPDYLELLYSAITKFDADIATAGQMFLLPDGKKVYRFDADENTHGSYSTTSNDALTEIFYGNICTTFCGDKLYKREIIQDIVPMDLTMGEDTSITLEAFLKAKTVAHEKKPLYYYRQQPDSTTHSQNAGKYYDYIKLTDAFAEKFQQSDENIAKAFRYERLNFNFTAYLILCKLQGYDNKIQHIVDNIRLLRMSVLRDKRSSLRTRIACICSLFGMKTFRLIHDLLDKHKDERKI